MLKTLSKIGVKFPKIKYKRSEESLNNLMEAAEILVSTREGKKLNARELSKVSGYSVGGIAKRAGQIENLFLHAIAHGRSKLITEISEDLLAYGDEKTAREYAERLVGHFFNNVNKVGVEVMKYYESRAIGRTKTAANAHAYTEECIPTMKEVIRRNKSNTFREISDPELKLIARCIFVFLEQPYIQDDPIAGTPEHRAMAVHLIACLLSKNEPNLHAPHQPSPIELAFKR